MRPALLAPLAASLVALAAACGDGDGASKTLHASCDARERSGQCAAYALTGVFAESGVENVRTACAEQGGAFGATCDAAGAVGRCLVVSGDARTEVWYYPPLFDASSGAAACAALEGIWTAP